MLKFQDIMKILVYGKRRMEAWFKTDFKISLAIEWGFEIPKDEKKDTSRERNGWNNKLRSMIHKSHGFNSFHF